LYSPIALQEFDEQKYREFLRIHSDEKLIKKQATSAPLRGRKDREHDALRNQ
jgi:hypothetical protein